MNMALAAHAHEVLHLLIEGCRVAPDTAPKVEELLLDFSDRARPLMQEQLRTDLLTTPPDDRDEQWRKYWAATEEN